MTALEHNGKPVRRSARETRWLAALEKELRRRVGWVDEAVSPFASKSRAAQAAPKIRPEAFPAETTPRAA